MVSTSDAAPGVLIIDDDSRILNLMEEILQGAGFTTYPATSGFEGIKLLHSVGPHVIILDVGIPDMDGMQVCRLIRSDDKFRNVPILILTGRGDIRDMMEARKMGATDYMVKPFDAEQLISKVERLL